MMMKDVSELSLDLKDRLNTTNMGRNALRLVVVVVVVVF